MRMGLYISGIGHGIVILWLLFGGLFWSRPAPEDVRTTEVALISGEEFAAMVAGAQESEPEVAEEAPQPVAPEIETSPPPRPRPEVRPEVRPEPEAAPPVPEVPEAPDQPAEELPQVAPTRPAELPVAPTTPEPPAPDDVGAPDAPDTGEETPRDAPRVAPEPVLESQPDVAPAETAAPAVSPEAETPEVAEEQPAAAPEEATTEIVTEAETPDAGITSSPRPRARPADLARRAEAARQAEREAAAAAAAEAQTEPASDPITDPITDAVAEAAASAAQAAAQAEAPVRAGPPMTAGEKDAMRLSVQRCWNLGALSTEAQRVVVTVAFDMNRDATPVASSLRMIDAAGGSAAAAKQAYEVARRAILICGSKGFDLPAEKYDQWRQIEIIFNPEQMRVK